MTFTFPLRPSTGVIGKDAHLSDAFIRYASDPAWTCEVKLNDIRTIVHFENGGFKLFNRYGQPLTDNADNIPSVWKQLTAAAPLLQNSVLDCLLFSRRSKHKRDSVTVIDAMRLHGEPLFASSWQVRRMMLEGVIPRCNLLLMWSERCGNVASIQSKWVQWREENVALGEPYFEGVIFKAIASPYTFSLKEQTDSPYWVKFKYK